MTIVKLLNNSQQNRRFSIEVLPPLKGTGTSSLFSTVDRLKEYCPAFINVTTHHSEYIYRQLDGNLIEKARIKRRPGTIAIAATLQNKYDIPVVPHVICSGTTIEQIEYELLDLQFLGISDLLLLRGDKAKEDKYYTPAPEEHTHTVDLISQVQSFNNGFFHDGASIKNPSAPFHYGVACYPEKHEEAPNLETDIQWLKKKQDLGAEYAITQLFYDNNKYFDYIKKVRKAGVTIPIIPGIKPLAKLNQLSIVPKTFHCDIPHDLSKEALCCRDDAQIKDLGIRWAVAQCRELYDNGIKNIHFYTVSAVDSVVEIIRQIL